VRARLLSLVLPGLLCVPTLLAGACGSTSSGGTSARSAKDDGEPPDERALAHQTLVQARTARVVVSERWRDRMKLEAIRTQSGSREGTPETVAYGAAVLQLGNLRVETSDRLEIRWMGPEHEDFLLHARDVAVFSRVEGYDNRVENVAAATMANETVHFFQQ